MSQLIKRTKKTCLKFLQRISSSKQLYMQKLEEDDVSTQNVVAANENSNQCHNMLNSKYSNTQDISNTQTKSTTRAIADDAQQNPVQDTQADLNTTILNTLNSELLHVTKNLDLQQLEAVDNAEIVFEKVQYRKNVRYFRHTPSSSSLDNYWEKGDREKTQECGIHLEYVDNMSLPDWNGNVSKCSLHWDWNGNSLEENLFINENIDSFNSKWFNMETKRGKQLKPDASHQSSTHSSSTTLETWLDDCTGYESEEFLLNDQHKQHRCGLNNI